jgi:hypothetical protein
MYRRTTYRLAIVIAAKALAGGGYGEPTAVTLRPPLALHVSCQGYALIAALREYRPSDEETVVGVSLRAWEPAFDALEEALVGATCRRSLGWRCVALPESAS